MSEAEPRLSLKAWALGRVAVGWSAAAVATAAGVSTRTAYRWIADLERVVGDHVATFAIRRRRAPVRVSSWTKLTAKA